MPCTWHEVLLSQRGLFTLYIIYSFISILYLGTQHSCKMHHVFCCIFFFFFTPLLFANKSNFPPCFNPHVSHTPAFYMAIPPFLRRPAPSVVAIKPERGEREGRRGKKWSISWRGRGWRGSAGGGGGLGGYRRLDDRMGQRGAQGKCVKVLHYCMPWIRIILRNVCCEKYSSYLLLCLCHTQKKDVNKLSDYIRSYGQFTGQILAEHCEAAWYQRASFNFT